MSFLFGDNSAADAAANARAEEAARQGRINTGTAKVNQVFSQFDDPYYAKVSDAALNYYKPEVERQYADARKATTFNLARGGKLASTAGAEALRKLADAKARTDVDVANRSQSFATDMRGKIEGQRSDVLNSLFATADPDSAHSSATTAAQLASATPSYSPLNDLFTAFVTTGANALAAERAGYKGAGTGLFSSPKGSSHVVNA